MAVEQILVVDDDRQVLKYLTEILQDAGFDTVACNRFQDAKALLATTHPALLLTDVRLGAYNGLQLGFYARSQHPDLPIIILTGYEDPTLREEARRSGAEFLVKPVTRAALLESVQKAIASRPDEH
jgi:DNA-binding NtrC family response regulator